VDFGMNAQEAVDAGRMHHQWLPDRLSMERYGFSADTIAKLKAMGHTITEGGGQGVAEVIVVGSDGVLEGGVDGRATDGGAGGK
jgi:gamma-glutamyltranspeptidase / glutathione hydrolase